MEEFVACFAEVIDPRQDNARHNLHELLLIALCTILTGGREVDSSCRGNTLTEGVAMRAGRRRSARALRAVLPGSPGRPGVAQRENRRRFWAAIAAGRARGGAGIEGGGGAAGGGPLGPGGGGGG